MTVSRHLTRLIALWFVVQIVVPFTAPLQVIDANDLLGGTAPRTAHSAPESSTTPAIREGTAVSGFASLVTSIAPTASPIAGADTIDLSPLPSIHRPPPAVSVQRPTLRL
jgi:hypothetical protein